MTTLRDFGEVKPVVNYDEPPVRPAPLLAVGPLAWARKNLFSSWWDSLLTIMGVLIIVGAVSSFLVWAIQQANWFVINFNLRLYLLGRFEPEYEWRVALLTLLVAFTVGVAFAAWGRIGRGVLIAMAVMIALLFILPPIISATLSTPVSIFAAGDMDIAASGTDTIKPQPQLAFIARAGETVSLRIADESAASEETLRQLAGFSDKAANQLRNAADTRLTTQARLEEINALLAGDSLTRNQRDQLTIELGKLTLADPILETYALNQNPVLVRILRGPTGEIIGEAMLSAGDAPLTVTLPEDGWYVLEKNVSGSAALLEAQGIFPHLERTITRSGEEISDTTTAIGSVAQYARMTDSFTTEEARPLTEDGKNMPMNTIIDNQYRGTRTFSLWLRMFVGPFFDQIKVGVLLIALALIAGYAAGRFMDRLRSPAEDPRRYSRRAATWLLIAVPVLMFGLVYGFFGVLPLTDTRRWGGMLLTMLLTVVGIIASFPLGILLALGRRSQLPVVSLLSTIYIEFVRGVPLITVLFMAQLLVPLVNPALAETPGVFRAMIGITLFTAAYLAENVRGGLQAIPHGQEEAARALGLNGLQITLYITLPQALRAVIPALVGMFISLFKDTSLVIIVGLLDFTGMGELVVAQTEFLGLRREIYIFLIVGYFGFSYVMAAISRRIEASGAGRTLTQKI
jgi:His/Glu/Gln/Arg/opine family amino acid ABC transporter permease subunit